MLEELRKFILRGNVIDLAIGVVMGAAFGAIVTSMVSDIIMPIIGFITAGISFGDLAIVLSAAEVVNGEIVSPEVAIRYGQLLEVTLQFLVIALCIFFVIKAINKVTEKFEKKKELEAEVAATEAKKSDDILLLEEIRDLLKSQQDGLKQ